MKKFLGLAVVTSAALLPSVVLASASGSITGVTPDSANFGDAKGTVQSWALGDLGIAASTVGGLFGLFNAVGGNIKMAAVGAGIAFLGAFSPSIIESIYSATI